MRASSRCTVVVAVSWSALGGGASMAAAQGWAAEAYAGRVSQESGTGPAQSSSLALGVRYADTRTWFRLVAGLPVAEDDALWGAAALWRRVSAGTGMVTAGVDLTGQAVAYRARQRTADLLGQITSSDLTGTILTGEALGLVGFGTARARLELRAGGAHLLEHRDADAHTRTIGVADARVSVSPTANLALSAIVRGFRTEDSDPVYAGVSAYLARGRTTLFGSAGRWSGVDVESPSWAAGATLELNDRISLIASGRHDAFDPLHRPSLTSWSLGVSIGLGEAGGPAAPVPAAYVNGRATVVLPASAARAGRPRIAGDFNGWRPEPMTRAGDEWTYTVAVDPGVYSYAFVTEDGEWYVPESVAGRKDDGMGGHVAVLVVR